MIALTIHFLQLSEDQFLEMQAELDTLGIGDDHRLLHLDGPLEEGWQVFQVWDSEAAYLTALSAIRSLFEQKRWLLQMGTWSWPVHQWIVDPSHPLPISGR